ncbi:MAG: GNAT family N-acetyltransferase [Acidobacteriota bacterium]
MAALPEYRSAEPAPLVDLREVHASYLDLLLMEENTEWLGNLDWDFEPSANLVRRFLGMRGLTGFALTGPRHFRSTSAPPPPVGYAYYVADEGKGLVGGLYVAPAYRTRENEDRLMRAVLDALWQTPGLYRVEAQLMLLADPFDRAVPYASRFHSHARQFLEIPVTQIVTLHPKDPSVVVVMPWTENRRGEAARLISESYRGHIDSQINDQYQSAGGARRFLTNIVEYPGCGAFFPQGSFVALDGNDRKNTGGGHALAGMSLASIVAPGSGHITQVCVSPQYRGTGLGYELLRRSMVSLAAHGCHKVSLTVTTANVEAASLYHRMGFIKRRDFAAYVWELR